MLQGQRGEAGPDQRCRGQPGAAQCAQAPLAADQRRRLGRQRRQSLRRDARLQVGGCETVAQRGLREPAARSAAGRIGERDRLLVGVEHFGGNVRPGKALGPLSGRQCHALASRAVKRETAQRLGERERVTGRHQLAIDAVAHDVAIAGDVRSEHGRGRREGLGEDHAKALTAERGRAEHVGARQLGELARLRDLAQRMHAAIVERHVRDLLRRRTDERECRRHVIAQCLEGTQQDGQALALDDLSDKQDAQLSVPALVRAGLRARQCEL